MPLICRNTTLSHPARRSLQAWHARGQGFESPKLHNKSKVRLAGGAERGASGHADFLVFFAKILFIVVAPVVMTGLSWCRPSG
jgi:hypothetical protein